MKTRNGFVSNSSSSSFLIICPKQSFIDVCNKMHKFYIAWMKQNIGRIEYEKFLGQDIVVINRTFSSEDGGDLKGWNGKLPKGVEDYREDNYDSALFDNRAIWGNIVEFIQKNCKDAIIKDDC